MPDLKNWNHRTDGNNKTISVRPDAPDKAKRHPGSPTFMETLLNTKDISIKCGEEMKFKVVVEEDLEDGGYFVCCPTLKGCWSQGDVIEEALENIKEAIVGYLKTLNEKAMHYTKRVDKICWT